MASAAPTEAERASAERQQMVRQLYERATNPDTPRASRAQFWGELWQFKKEAKKGWDVLGLTPKEAERCKLNKPDWV
jgi:hypothetical protein